MKKRIIGISTVDITSKEIDAVVAVLKSKKISPGEIQKKFENLIGGLHGFKTGTLVNSGQSALHLSLETIKLVRPSVKYVVCPATTYISTLHAVWNANLEVVLVDVDPLTFNWTPSINDLAIYNTEQYVLCPVNLMGASANINNSWDIIRDNTDYLIVEDNCESLVAPHTGYGHFMCLSFYAAHQITTSSGGMVCCRDEQHDLIIKSLCNHGRLSSIDLYSATRNDEFDKSKKFIFDKVGFSYKLGDFNAALGLAQAERVFEIIGKNISNANLLTKKLEKFTFVKTPVSKDNTFMNYALVCNKIIKQDLIKHLNEWKIETRDLMPILGQPIVEKKLKPKWDNFPNSTTLLHNGFYIGCHGDITLDDIDYIEYVFSKFTEKLNKENS
jgi:dTDP-4-amino-4,6-dideoxygalactose transaminase